MKEEQSIKIESGIEVPRHCYGKWKFLKEMKIGQSFLVGINLRNSVISASVRYKVKVLTRTISDTAVRVWRIK